jgi:hypothetical protein
MSDPTMHESPRLDVDLSEVKGVIMTSGQWLTVSEVTFANAVLSTRSLPGNESKEPMALLAVVHHPQGGSYRALIKRESIAGFWLG